MKRNLLFFLQFTSLIFAGIPMENCHAQSLQWAKAFGDGVIDYTFISTGSGCGINQLQVNLTPPEREENYGSIVRNEKQFSEYDNEFKQWEKEFAFIALKDEGWHPLNAPDDSLFQNFIGSLEQTNLGKFREIILAIEQNDLIQAESKNNSIVPDNVMEENRKMINNIYLKTHAVEKQEFDASQQVTLESIACQDPLEGGDAVYSARALLRNESNCQYSARMANSDSVNSLDSNLVKNNSFEQYYNCPDQGGQLNYVKNWFEPFPCTADYFNVCGNQTTGIPKNFAGYQQSQNGDGYIGVGMYGQGQASGMREYAEGELNVPLEQGKKYCVEFYVSLALQEQVLFHYGIRNIGCLFTVDTFIPDFSGFCKPSNHPSPQIENTQGVITDSSNWVKITGEFIANGSEKFLTIGNFQSDSNTTAIFLGDSMGPFGFAYYYIDNVSIHLCDTLNNIKQNLKNSNLEIAFSEIYPNPSDGRMTLEYHLEKSANASLQIFNLKGALLFTQKLNPEENSMVLDNLALENGIFYYSITVDGKRTINKKLVVIR